ncbi:hypothetical protein K466DRAFT_588879 [Polyporus arcularius HHB13444]|uniref:Uncharacterized protein n=1 Tax=Polyporus arcularius HHB13444 TaxID=1314778 RepID=A0A5C3P684_9APHY|nr:hypothetical protein K466DRAFT_588879 [Polyporus arcularius HHB13444]
MENATTAKAQASSLLAQRGGRGPASWPPISHHWHVRPRGWPKDGGWGTWTTVGSYFPRIDLFHVQDGRKE